VRAPGSRWAARTVDGLAVQLAKGSPTTDPDHIPAALPSQAAHGSEGTSAGALLAPALPEVEALPELETLRDGLLELPPEPHPEAERTEDDGDDPVPEPDAPAARRHPLRRAARLARHGFGAALVVVLFYTLSFHLSVVRGSSMSPGIHDGDRILVEPWSYVFADVQRGDVVVMQSPVDPAVDYIKRVIGLPGDEVLIAAGGVWVNGQLLTEPYAVPGDSELFQWTRVLGGHYYVLGDNRPHSSDSREFGQVPSRFLRGRVDVRVWPPLRAGWVQ